MEHYKGFPSERALLKASVKVLICADRKAISEVSACAGQLAYYKMIK
jgi:hypothetical protein